MNKEVILGLQEALEELLTQSETKSYVEQGCDCTTGCCTSEETDEDGITPIEECITTFLNKCTEEGRVPTLDEAKSIYILDQINSKYN